MRGWCTVETIPSQCELYMHALNPNPVYIKLL